MRRYRAIYATDASGGFTEFSAADDLDALAQAHAWSAHRGDLVLLRTVTAVPTRQLYPEVDA